MESRYLDKNVPLLLQIVVWIFAFYIAWNVVPGGYEKMLLPEQAVNFFSTLGYPVWILMMVGIVEFFSPILMFIPRLSFYGAVPLAVVMAFATYHSGNILAITIGILSLIIALLTRPSYLRKKPKITRISV